MVLGRWSDSSGGRHQTATQQGECQFRP